MRRQQPVAAAGLDQLGAKIAGQSAGGAGDLRIVSCCVAARDVRQERYDLGLKRLQASAASSSDGRLGGIAGLDLPAVGRGRSRRPYRLT